MSNDYLGLARSEALAAKIAEAEAAYGLPTHGSTGSRLLSGHSELAAAVEQWTATKGDGRRRDGRASTVEGRKEREKERERERERERKRERL